MVQTSQMPKSVQADISVDAVGTALLQHYNVGITNPWFEIGASEQETYNRRMLPWSGNNYSVDANGNVSGPNVDQLDSNLTDQWAEMAEASRNVLKGNRYAGLEALLKQGLNEVGEKLEKSNSHQEVSVETAEGGSKTVRRYVPPAER